MTIFDVDRKKPSKPGYYILEDSTNSQLIAWWDGKDWFIHTEFAKIIPQTWSSKTLTENDRVLLLEEERAKHAFYNDLETL